jgi:hypothetical protein
VAMRGMSSQMHKLACMRQRGQRASLLSLRLT